MIQNSPSATRKPHLDDLLAMMGITHEQLAGMTAEDLFAAATRCQEAATVAAAEVRRFAPPTGRLLDSLQGRSAGPARLN